VATAAEVFRNWRRSKEDMGCSSKGGGYLGLILAGASAGEGSVALRVTLPARGAATGADAAPTRRGKGFTAGSR
jgi:hypothetical protein